MSQQQPRRAIALSYDGEDLPKIVASGQHQLAEEIVALAREAGVPEVDDPQLAAALATLDVGDEIPESLFRAVAEVLSYALYISGKHEAVLKRAREQKNPKA
ncbi:MAG TPA: flagellar protein FhlB [Halothiobacillaceae bacterium]|nr:flagellar protein FhlB [Halothiobacillaceae bacterium]